MPALPSNLGVSVLVVPRALYFLEAATRATFRHTTERVIDAGKCLSILRNIWIVALFRGKELEAKTQESLNKAISDCRLCTNSQSLLVHYHEGGT